MGNKIICQKCGEKNEEYFNYCANCGEVLCRQHEEIKQPEPTQNASVVLMNEKMICQACGHANPSVNNFCSNCAAPLTQKQIEAVCQSCGVTNPYENNFCGNCGAAVPHKAFTAPQQHAEIAAPTLPAPAFLFIAYLALGGISAVLYFFDTSLAGIVRLAYLFDIVLFIILIATLLKKNWAFYFVLAIMLGINIITFFLSFSGIYSVDDSITNIAQFIITGLWVIYFTTSKKTKNFFGIN